MTVRTPLCDLLGIEHPIVGFTPSEHVAAAVSRAGGLGVLGCVRFNDPADLEAALDWMDKNTDGRPYGIDVVMPARVPAEGAARDLNQLIPEGHKDFVEQTLLKLGVPPLPDGTQAADGVLGWLHSVARQHVEVALAHPARLIANALGPPPPDVIAGAHERGMLVAALAGKAEHALKQVASGVDIVVAQGYEAGGHTGEIGSMVLIPEIVNAVGGTGAGARRGRDRLRPPDRGRARARRRRGLDGLGLAAHAGVRAADLGAGRHRGAARGHLVGHRPVQDLQRQTRPPAEEPVDRRLGPAGRARAAPDAAAEPARQRGAPAPHAVRAAGRGADAGRADRGPDDRGPAGRRGDGHAHPGNGRDPAPAARQCMR